MEDSPFYTGKRRGEMMKAKSAKKDNWVHRSEKMLCRYCMWWVPKVPLDIKINREVLGRCRRHAPTLSGWVAVYASDWCGDHKLDENK